MGRRVVRASTEAEWRRPWLTAAPTSLDHRVPLRAAPPAEPVPEPVEPPAPKKPKEPVQQAIPLTLTKNDPAREFYPDMPLRGEGDSWSDFPAPPRRPEPVAPKHEDVEQLGLFTHPYATGVQSPIPLGGQDFQWSDSIPEEEVYRALVEKYNAASDDQKRWGSQWYDTAGEYIRNLSQATGRSESQVAAVMAAFSPQTAWDPNMQQATYFLLNHDPSDPGSMKRMRDAMPSIGANLDRAARIMDADGNDDAAIEAALGGGNDTPKIKNFWRGMLGDRDAMTIDTWMVRAMLGQHLDLGDSAAAQDVLNWAGSYDKLSAVARRAAKDLGVDPRALQAIVWSQVNPSADYSPLSPDAWKSLDDARTKRWTEKPMKKPMPDYTHGPGWRALPAPALSGAPGYAPSRAAAAEAQPIYRVDLPAARRLRAAAPVKLYRGVRVNLPDDIVAEMREKLADPTTAAEFGRELQLGPRILDHLATQPWEATVGGALHDWTGLGPHWHTDPRFAHTAAYGDLDERQQGNGKRDWPLLMVAEWDGSGSVDTFGGDSLEKETQLGRGTPLRVTSLLLQPELVPGGGVKGRELLWRPDWQRLTESHGISTGGPRQYTAGRRVAFRLGWYEKDESLPGNWALPLRDGEMGAYPRLGGRVRGVGLGRRSVTGPSGVQGRRAESSDQRPAVEGGQGRQRLPRHTSTTWGQESDSQCSLTRDGGVRRATAPRHVRAALPRSEQGELRAVEPELRHALAERLGHGGPRLAQQRQENALQAWARVHAGEHTPASQWESALPVLPSGPTWFKPVAGLRFELGPPDEGKWAYAIEDEARDGLATGETLAELCWDGDTGEVNWIETYKGHRRRGIARDLFHWVRNNHQSDLHHSDDLSEDGRAFAEAVAALRVARRLLRGF